MPALRRGVRLADARAGPHYGRRQLGYRYETKRGDLEHYQWICPRCRRRCSGWRRRDCGRTGCRRNRPRTPTRLAVNANGFPDRSYGRPHRCPEEPIMAATPAADSDITDKFGPHLAYAIGSDPRAAAEPDRLVKTHCCFCGQQCGIQLKVKGNQVVGFEPWEEFPFNRGMLCPKGVKRTCRDRTPTDCSAPIEREPNARSGFIAVPYNRRDRKSRRRDSAHPVGPWERRLRGAERRQPDHGKSLLDG